MHSVLALFVSSSFCKSVSNKRSLRDLKSITLGIGAVTSTSLDVRWITCCSTRRFSGWRNASLHLSWNCAARFRSEFGERFSRGTGDCTRTGVWDSVANPEENVGDLDGLREERDLSACCCNDIPVESSLTKTPSIWRMHDSQTTKSHLDMNSVHSKSVCTTLKCIRSKNVRQHMAKSNHLASLDPSSKGALKWT